MTRKKHIKRLDTLWSLVVRNQQKCEWSGQKGDLKAFDAHHIIRRSNLSTRWSLENGCCLTKGVHRFKVHMDTMTAHQLIEKLKIKRGEDWYKKLVRDSNKIVKLYEKDFEEIFNKLNEQL